MTQNDGRYLCPKFSSYQKEKVKQIKENQALVSAEPERKFVSSKQRVGNTRVPSSTSWDSLSPFFQNTAQSV